MKLMAVGHDIAGFEQAVRICRTEGHEQRACSIHSIAQRGENAVYGFGEQCGVIPMIMDEIAPLTKSTPK